MSDYSSSPLDLLVTNQQKGYVGLHIQQGVPILDRDLNLLQDLITATVRSVITRYIGNGICAGADGFAVQALVSPANVQNFNISAGAAPPGTCLAGGMEVSITADTTYQAQSTVALTTPTAAQANPRVDTVYLDVSLTEIDGSTDASLNNTQDIGIATSARLKPLWVVRVAEGAPVPAAPSGHFYYPLATLQRPLNVTTIDATMITDLRQRHLTVSAVEGRVSLIEKLLVVPVFSNPAVQPQFAPRSGQINQLITISGMNLNVGTLQVLFNNVAAKIAGSPSPTQVVVKVPSGLTPAGTPVVVKVTVSNQGGSTVSTDSFTVESGPAFTDPGTQFSPAQGLPTTPITLNGFNFNATGLQVLFGAVAAVPTGVPTANQIVVPVPAGLVPAGNTSANVKVTVTNSFGSIVSDDTFTAEANVPAPAFAPLPPGPQFGPRNGVGNQAMQLFGTNFNFAPVTVAFVAQVGGASTNAVISGAPSATQIAVQIPPGMTTAGVSKLFNISVTTPGGTATSTDTFTVTGP
jgi:hypothetical protein